jgi:NADPH:quinone reductase-like Zn-dependent oxidoreductase
VKALVFHQHGEADVLQLEEDLPRPDPGEGEVQVRLHAAALNHLDIWVRRGWPGLRLDMPHIGGADGAGTISAVGPAVTGFAEGARVVICPGFATAADEFTRRGQHSLSPRFSILGESRSGTFAEYVTVPSEALMEMPEDADFEATAAVPLVFLTAWRMLITQARLRPGESVLVVGAGGGVNSAAIQIARLAGAEVFALTSSPEKMERARNLGADHVFDYRDGDWSTWIKEMTRKRGVDVVVDNVGKATFQDSLKVLCRGGRLLTVGNTSGPKVEVDIRFIFSKQLHIIGSTMGTPEEFHQVMTQVWAGKLSAVIDRVLPLAEGREAHLLLEQGVQFGKVVLTP